MRHPLGAFARTWQGSCLLLAGLAGLAAAGCGTKQDALTTSGNVPRCAAPGYEPQIRQLLGQHCVGCHASTVGGQARQGAPGGVDYDGFDRAVHNAVRGNALIQSGSMPPTGGLSSSDRALFAAWVGAGTPQNPPTEDCDGGVSAVDGGATLLHGCVSGTFWRGGGGGEDGEEEGEEDGSPLMNPGRDCNACHVRGEGPHLAVAGTVYPSIDAPDDCYGSPGAKIELTDSTGHVATLTSNATGNFLAESGFSPPLRIRVLRGDTERRMVGAAPYGDCNRCHSAAGASDAPGRVLLP